MRFASPLINTDTQQLFELQCRDPGRPLRISLGGPFLKAVARLDLSAVTKLVLSGPLITFNFTYALKRTIVFPSPCVE